MKILATIKECLTFVIIQLSQNIMIIQIGKMKDEAASVAIEEFIGLKPKMYSYLVDDNSEHKKAKGVNKNVVATISHNEYKDFLMNKKCFNTLRPKYVPENKMFQNHHILYY